MSSLGVESEDWHKKNGKEMKRLSNRLRGYTIPIKKAPAIIEKEKEERIDQLSDLQKSTSFVFFIISTAWISLILTLSIHTNLSILGSNVAGLAFLVLSTSVIGIQFVTMFFHRVETLLQTIAYIPMTVSCNFVSRTEDEKKVKVQLLGPGKKLSQVLSEQSQESTIAKFGRTILGLPERKHSTFQRRTGSKASVSNFRPAFQKKPTTLPA